jgi:hypothetical protein
MCTPAPATLAKRLSPAQAHDVTQWWRGLAPADREALRRDVGRAPPGVRARYVDGGQDDDGVDSVIDFYEHLVNCEVVLGDGRRFQICSAHPAARAVLAAGRIPAAFRCPRADASCPMRALLDRAPGCDVRLSLLRPSSGQTRMHTRDLHRTVRG